VPPGFFPGRVLIGCERLIRRQRYQRPLGLST